MIRAAGLVGAVWMLAFASAAVAASAKDITEGRHHLKKANGLAAEAKCDAAIREYTAAYQKLHDPVVLFNRAECYRRLGQNGPAALDYRAFLDAFPHAPNRAEVEARLSALEGLPPPVPGPPVVRPPPPRVLPPPVVTPPPVRAAAPPEPPPVSAPAAPPPPPALVAEPSSVTPPAPAAPAIVVDAQPAPTGADPGSSRRLWVWAVIGAAVAAGAAGAYLALRSPGASPPATELGNYKF